MSFKKPYLAIGLLAFACLLFSILVTLQNTRIVATDLSEDPRNQRYVMQLSDEVSAENIIVAIYPEIAHSLRTEGRTVYVDFDEQPLRYDTTYRLSLRIKTDDSSVTTLSSSFTTQKPTLYYAQRHALSDDELRRTIIGKSEEEVIFTHPVILSFAVAKESFIVAVEEESTVQLYIHNGRKSERLSLPEGLQLRAIDGSTTRNTYAFTLEDDEIKTSGWQYDASEQTWREIVPRIGESLLTSSLLYAPDGQSVYYFDQNRNLQLDDPDDDRNPTTLGVFDAVNRFLPNQKGIFVVRSNSYETLTPQGKSIEAPKIVQNTSLPRLLQKNGSYVYVAQRLDENDEGLSQYVTRLDGEKQSILAQDAVTSLLYLGLEMSPNDEFIVTEEASQPVIYDQVPLNNKPANVITHIRNTETGETVLQLEGFDLLWR